MIKLQVTLEDIVKCDPCQEGVDWFKEHYPDGIDAELNADLFVEMVGNGFGRWLNWSVSNGLFLVPNLRGANLRGVSLYGANLRGVNLYGAYLIDAKLMYTDLLGANLYSANLRGANLYSANLRGANLRGADLTGVNLRGADLSDDQKEYAESQGAIV